MDKIPTPLAPNGSFEVGLDARIFSKLLGADEFKKYMNTEHYEKCVITVTASFKDVSGKLFSSKCEYSFYVGEFWPAKHLGS